jgi:hypothetical protein
MQEIEEESETQNPAWDNNSTQGSNADEWNQDNNSDEWETEETWTDNWDDNANEQTTNEWNQDNTWDSETTIYENENIAPWDTINGFTLNWAFEITIKVDEIPEEKQYLLFANDWKFRLFFGNWTIWEKWEICFQNYSLDIFCKTVIDKEIKISRDSDWNILLYWEFTWRKVNWDIKSFNVWILPIWTWLLKFTNTIEKITIK